MELLEPRNRSAHRWAVGLHARVSCRLARRRLCVGHSDSSRGASLDSSVPHGRRRTCPDRPAVRTIAARLAVADDSLGWASVLTPGVAYINRTVAIRRTPFTRRSGAAGDCTAHE